MDVNRNEYVIVRVDENIEIKLSLDKFNEFDKLGRVLIFDFHEHECIIMPNVLLDKKGE